MTFALYRSCRNMQVRKEIRNVVLIHHQGFLKHRSVAQVKQIAKSRFPTFNQHGWVAHHRSQQFVFLSMVDTVSCSVAILCLPVV